MYFNDKLIYIESLNRGWYKDAYMNKGFVWTLPYVESSEKNMALAGTMPLRDNNGKRLG